MSEYFKTADVWTVLDLIVAEFTSDPMSVQCFDLRLVARAKELNLEHRAGQTNAPELLDAAKGLLARIEEVYRPEYASAAAVREPESLLGCAKRLADAIAKAERSDGS